MSLDITFYLNDEPVFEANITHNLINMAREAGIYEILWRPEENEIKKATQMVPSLVMGLQKLKSNSIYFSQLNAENGWGTYNNFVPFVEGVLSACNEWPNAEVLVCR